ncbi:NAD(P)/FAD-dependent oxidoreductase [Streptomyces sp. NPDC015346]|uniref:NAD(P)/FAD-dependent oxidoreductase n=1 Tax=Streptomyces sp. NPDC015346 TaxID=3364954 RepID=UPI003702AB28
MSPGRRTLVVVGYGPVGHRLVAEVRALDRTDSWRIVVLGEEPRGAYDRIALSSLVSGRTPADLALPAPGSLVDVRLSTTVTGIDRDRRTVRCADGTRHAYDALVLATGSRPFVPPVPGHDLPHCLTYRTVEDIEALRAAARPGAPGVVVGGGLLGLEAADALRRLGMRPHVVEAAPRLMPLQVDTGGGRLLASLVRGLGVEVHCGATTVSVDADRVRLADGTEIEAGLVVFSAGIRPRDELAADAGLATGERGGFLVDDGLRTDDGRIWAVGECAAVEGRCHGLLAPGYRMAAAVARSLMGLAPTPFGDTGQPTRLKLLGIDVSGFGDIHARTEGAIEFSEADRAGGRYRKLVLGADGHTLLGRVEVGTAPAGS